MVEDKVLWSHKVILCAQTSYFSALFHSGMKEASQKKIILSEDIEYDIYNALLTFLYTDKVRKPFL